MVNPIPNPRRFKKWVTENGSYKLVALFVTVILWVTILGRRDFVLTRDMQLEFMVSPPYVAQSVADHVQVKVTGPRTALRKFSQGPSQIAIDLGKVTDGLRYVNIPPESVDLPFGVRLLAITPNRIGVQVLRGDAGKDGKK